ncbi:MAG TPA: hypothetical protein VNH18_30745, partial [Bryobacteraceae bacterium]|nr:hypothetical protein [Bryobacteraceae bacterium]
ASQIFHERLKQSEALNTWWNSIPAAKRTDFETTLHQVETATAYLGDEIVIAIPGGSKGNSPVVLAQLTKPGLDAFLRSQVPDAAKLEGHMRFDNGLFIAAGNAADLNRITGGFRGTPLFQHLAPAYQQGASWLFGADLAHLPGVRPNVAGLADARFFVAESRTVTGNTENRASVSFAHDRQGIAAWLSAPGPMGSLDFVSPDAGFAATTLLKNPAVIVDDITGMLSRTSGGGETSMTDSLRQEIASALGGEVTVALDGPLLPFPSWKLVAEIYYPERLQGAISRTVSDFNAKGVNERTGELKLTQSESEGRIFYKLQFEKLPFEANWTFIDGYWLAAANHELLVRSIQNRQTGYTLPKSASFRTQLPHDASSNFSGVVYHHLGQTLAPIANLINSPQLNALSKDDTPGVICFWAQSDRIDVATRGSIFGMNLESLLALQGAGPLKMLGQAATGMKSGPKQ